MNPTLLAFIYTLTVAAVAGAAILVAHIYRDHPITEGIRRFLKGALTLAWLIVVVVVLVIPAFRWAYNSAGAAVETSVSTAVNVASEGGKIAEGLAERAIESSKSTGDDYHLVVYADSSYSHYGSNWTGPYGSIEDAREAANGCRHYEILLKSKDPNSPTGWDSKYR